MPLSELLNQSAIWLAWTGLGLIVITFISFVIGWKEKFRLVGITVFTLLLSGSCWAFSISYTPPLVVEGARYVPVVYDNGNDLVVAQAPEDFPDEAIKPTLEQLAGNLKGGGRSGAKVNIRLRKVEAAGVGISKPTVLGEVVRDIRESATTQIALEEYES